MKSAHSSERQSGQQRRLRTFHNRSGNRKSLVPIALFQSLDRAGESVSCFGWKDFALHNRENGGNSLKKY